ncbi:MAG TPA: FecR domain-containing protein, partial [Polyangiales bacterium]
MKLRAIAIVVTLAALLSVLLAWLWGTPPLARLSFAQGSVERDRRGAEGAWSSAEVGHQLGLGDGLRTGRASRARLALSHGTVLQVDADTTLRLLSAAPGQERFQIERGSAEVEAGEAELSIETSAGTVRVQRKGRLRLREEQGDTWVRVDMGRAELGWSPGRALEAGQEARPQRAPTAGIPELSATAPRAARSEPTPAADQGVAALVRGEVSIQREGELETAALKTGAHRLELGTRVTVAADSTLELEQGQGGSLLTSGRAELVVGDGAHRATRVLSGKLRASAGRVPVELEVPGGRIVLMVDETGAGAAMVNVSRKETRVDVGAGAVSLHGQGGDETLHAGGSGTLAAEAAVPSVEPDTR